MLTLPQGLRTLAAVDLLQGLALPEVQDRLRKFLRLQGTGQRGLAFYLTEVADRRLYQATGHGSAAHFAEDCLDLDRRRTSELICVGRKLLTLPAIDRAFCEGRISWSRVMQLVKVASSEHDGAWLARALELTYRQLVLEVRLGKEGRAPRSPGDLKGLPEVRFPFRCSLSALTQRKIELVKQKLAAERGHALNDAECLDILAEMFLQSEEDGSLPGRTRVSSSLYRIVLRPGEDAPGPDGGALLVDTDIGPVPIDGESEVGHAGCVQSACVRCDAEAVSQDDDDDSGTAKVGARLGKKTPPRLRHRVLARDGHCCRNCDSRERLMVHHIRFRSRGGRTKVWNLITLCARCHALVHEGLLVIEGERAEVVRFRDAGGRHLGEAGSRGDPPILTAVRPLEAARPAPLPVVLDAIPDRVDGAWWRSHGHLIRFRRDQCLEFKPGQPLPESDLPTRGEASPTSAQAEATVPFPGLVGLDDVVERLVRTAEGSRRRGRSFPHTLIAGPPGTGKTTLARGVAAARGSRLHVTTGPLMKDAHVLIRLLAALGEADTLFIDEIHDVPRSVLELLYEAMSDRRIGLTLHAGARARCIQLTLPSFTLLAATTEEGDLPPALRSRFGLRESLVHYEPETLAALVALEARGDGVVLSTRAASVLASHARGTPREALRILDRTLDAFAARKLTRVDSHEMRRALAALGYDEEGMDPTEQEYLRLLRGSPGPVALQRLARMLGVAVRTLIDHVEPHLFRRGLIEMTARGRVAVRLPRLPHPAALSGVVPGVVVRNSGQPGD